MAETLLSHGLVCLSEIDSNFNADETYLKCQTCSLYQRLLSLQPSVPRALLLSRLYLQHTLLLQLHLCRLPVGRLSGRGGGSDTCWAFWQTAWHYRQLAHTARTLSTVSTPTPGAKYAVSVVVR